MPKTIDGLIQAISEATDGLTYSVPRAITTIETLETSIQTLQDELSKPTTEDPELYRIKEEKLNQLIQNKENLQALRTQLNVALGPDAETPIEK